MEFLCNRVIAGWGAETVFQKLAVGAYSFKPTLMSSNSCLLQLMETRAKNSKAIVEVLGSHPEWSTSANSPVMSRRPKSFLWAYPLARSPTFSCWKAKTRYCLCNWKQGLCQRLDEFVISKPDPSCLNNCCVLGVNNFYVLLFYFSMIIPWAVENAIFRLTWN